MDIVKQYYSSLFAKFISGSGKWLFWVVGFIFYFWYFVIKLFVMFIWKKLDGGNKNDNKNS